MWNIYQRKDSSQLNLITHFSVDSAHKSDANFTGSVIEDTKKKGLSPDLLTADTLYGSDENSQEAKDRGIDLLAPVSGPIASDNHTIADFVSSDEIYKEADPNCSESSKESTPSLSEEAHSITKCKDSEAIVCPAGHRSCGYRKTKKFNVYYFDSNICNSCNYRDKCPVKPGKKKYSLSFTDKDLRIANRRKFCKSEEFKE